MEEALPLERAIKQWNETVVTRTETIAESGSAES